ncbi:hypothetical protein BJ166DRAFT_122247 [Pestalotiopsis sp. NC0098]|nr:hypothetical protein BJ166DRAFT_122247 [Pestalotiopsis sp. NC0098]
MSKANPNEETLSICSHSNDFDGVTFPDISINRRETEKESARCIQNRRRVVGYAERIRSFGGTVRSVTTCCFSGLFCVPRLKLSNVEAINLGVDCQAKTLSERTEERPGGPKHFHSGLGSAHHSSFFIMPCMPSLSALLSSGNVPAINNHGDNLPQPRMCTTTATAINDDPRTHMGLLHGGFRLAKVRCRGMKLFPGRSNADAVATAVVFLRPLTVMMYQLRFLQGSSPMRSCRRLSEAQRAGVVLARRNEKKATPKAPPHLGFSGGSRGTKRILSRSTMFCEIS